MSLSQTQTTVWWLPEGKGGGRDIVKGKWGQIYGDQGDLTLGGEHTMQYTDDVL